MRTPAICSDKLARMQSVIGGVVGAFYTTTAEVQRKTLTADHSGGFIDTWSTVHEYPCSFTAYMIRPIERESDVRVQAISYWRFTFPSGTDILPTDRLIVGSRTFEIAGSGEGSPSVQHVVIALEIR